MSLAFSPNGLMLAAAVSRSDGHGSVRLWDLSNPDAEPTLLIDHDETIFSVAFSPNGKVLVAGSAAAVLLWETSDLAAAPTALLNDQGEFEALAFSPDGSILAAGTAVSGRGAVWLWDTADVAADPQHLSRREEIDPVTTLAFSPDGQVLATGGLFGGIRLWVVPTERLADEVCRQVWRNLTLEEWRRFVGPEVPYEQTCPNLPPGEGVVPTAGAAATPVSAAVDGFRPDTGGRSFLFAHSPITRRATRP
jgi:hypothetical protein